MQDIDFGIYLVDDILVKIDRASMAHSLESRVPFLDPVIAELALALPAKHKVRGLSKKRLLRRRAPAAAAGDRQRAQARLRAPGRGLVPRPAGAVRPRRALARAGPRAGVPRSRPR